MFNIYNTLTKRIDPFEPLHPPKVGLYTCGPTVYDYPHIGHGRKYVMDDILKRTLTASGYTVTHVQNVTDVGHLVSDGDEGEDKMEKGAYREGKTVWEVARFYEKEFYRDMQLLGTIPPDVICRATEHIEEQIDMVSVLLEKGFAYDTPEAVYFDISKRGDSNVFTGQKIEDMHVAVRGDVQIGKHKKRPADFALWFKRVGRFENHTMHWESPWGDGFPGWHIECSAMSMKYLGETLDIHTGGIDHIPVHHPNEIAQSESATGKPFVRYWAHHAFLMVNGEKMSKSTGNYYRLKDVVEKGYDPMDLRYLYLLTHYRKTLNFTWEGLAAVKEARKSLAAQMVKYAEGGADGRRTALSAEKLEKTNKLRTKFFNALANDLNTPQAVAAVWEVVKSNIPSEDKYDLVTSFDEVLGLQLSGIRSKVFELEISPDIQKLVDERNRLRAEKKWKEADALREELRKKGYELEDHEEKTEIKII